jgi:hypothetical protein
MLLRKQKPWSVHFKLENDDNVVKFTKKGRSKEEKVGRLKYNQFLLKRILSEVAEVRDMQRVIINGLKGAGYFHFDFPVIQKLVCANQLDLDILEKVHQAGRSGILPRDVAKTLPEYKDQKGNPIKQYYVTRQIDRMNKRLKYETGEVLFEKRGWRWALSQFGFESYGDVDKRSLEEFTSNHNQEDNIE